MRKVLINIDWVPDNFAAAPANEDIACVATGETQEDAKNNITDALRFHIEGLKEDNAIIPEELLAEWEPEFCLSSRVPRCRAE